MGSFGLRCTPSSASDRFACFTARLEPVADRGARLRLRGSRARREPPAGRASAPASTSASELNATSPTLKRFGSRSRKVRIAEMAASRRVGSTSSARIEPETSTTSITVALSSGTLRCVRGRASAPVANVSASRKSTSGTQRRTERFSSTTLGEHVEVRVGDREARAPPVDPPARTAAAAGRRAARAGRVATGSSRLRAHHAELDLGAGAGREGLAARRSRPTPSCRPASASPGSPAASSTRGDACRPEGDGRPAVDEPLRRECSRSWSSRPCPPAA